MTNPYEHPYNQDPNDPNQPGDYGRYGQTPQEPGGYPMYNPQPGYEQPGYGYGGYPVTGFTGGAGGGRRLLAYIVDGLLVGLVVNILATILGVYPAMDPAMMNSEAAMTAWMNEMAQTSATMGVLNTIVLYLYAMFLQTTDFSTVGKRLAGIRVTELDGSRLTIGTSAKRNAWLLVGLLPAFGGLIAFVLGLIIFFQAGQGDRTQGLNDRWARSRVLMRR